MIKKINTFVAEVVTELKKVAWSTKQELIDATWVVIISSFVLGIFIGTTDLALSKLLQMLIH